MKKNIKYVKTEIPIRYEEDNVPNDFPFRKNDVITFIIEHPTGKILNFPTDYELPEQWIIKEEKEREKAKLDETGIFRFYTKVTDNGSYYILDEDKNEIYSIQQEYVPDSYSIPGRYGDYIDFNINFKTGVIENWYGEKATFKEFLKDDDDDNDDFYDDEFDD